MKPLRLVCSELGRCAMMIFQWLHSTFLTAQYPIHSNERLREELRQAQRDLAAIKEQTALLGIDPDKDKVVHKERDTHRRGSREDDSDDDDDEYSPGCIDLRAEDLSCHLCTADESPDPTMDYALKQCGAHGVLNVQLDDGWMGMTRFLRRQTRLRVHLVFARWKMFYAILQRYYLICEKHE